jgi:hypothetical protein
MFIGYLDFKLGVFSEEAGFRSGKDPNIRKIKESLARIEEELNLKK